MRLKTRSTQVFKPVWLVLGLGLTISTPYAASFYTIIGPDGHPMIVQKPPESEKKQKVPQKKPEAIAQVVTPDVQNTQIESPAKQKKSSITPSVDAQVKIPQIPVEQSSQKQQPRVEKNVRLAPSVASIHVPVVPSPQSTTTSLKTKVDATQKVPVPRQSIQAKVTEVERSDLNQSNSQSSNSTVTAAKVLEPKSAEPKVSAPQEKVQDNQNFAMIDGEKYVNNEFLEESEFNLEGKKRFYMTPEIGVGHSRFETIERKKGLSLSFMERMLDKDPTPRKPIALSSTYYRLPKDEVVKNLEQSCFSGKKILKAKDLSIKNQELGVWPTAPIKENFAYEVVKLDGQVNNVLLTSYASSTKVPTYYWPLVVFLDQQGCVIEGVSGFKNEDINANDLQYASMEGILKKPSNATYMFLTPLSSAVDVEDRQLTNHGQIKLSVIQ